MLGMGLQLTIARPLGSIGLLTKARFHHRPGLNLRGLLHIEAFRQQRSTVLPIASFETPFVHVTDRTNTSTHQRTRN